MPTQIPGKLGGYFLQRKEWPPSRPLDRDDQPQLPLRGRALKIDDAVVANGARNACTVQTLCKLIRFSQFPWKFSFTGKETEAIEAESLSKVSWLTSGQLGIQTWFSPPLKSKFPATTLWVCPKFKIHSCPILPSGWMGKGRGWVNDFSWNLGTLKLWKGKKIKKKIFVLITENYFFKKFANI